jgi:FtsH-binding integral membrane protein
MWQNNWLKGVEMQNHTPQHEEKQHNPDYGYDSAHPGFEPQAAAVAIDQAGLASYLAKVFGWMFLGLFLTAATSYIVLGNGDIFYAIRPWVFPLMLVELGLVWFLASRIHSMSTTTCTISFFVYSFLNGLTIAPILASYTPASVASVFMITSGTFGLMAVYGLTTKKDLTSMGSILLMGLVGLILAMVVNIFMQSGMFSLIISCIAVFIFVGLTAYDAQKIKEQYITGMEYSETGHKLAIMGALMLYLDFVNLFLHLLNLLGNRD